MGKKGRKRGGRAEVQGVWNRAFIRKLEALMCQVGSVNQLGALKDGGRASWWRNLHDAGLFLVGYSGFVISSGALGKFFTQNQSLFLDFKDGLMIVTHCGNCEDCFG